jgi:hypothetical protein
MLSAWFAVAWFFSRGASAMRPSALTRMYALIWLFVGSFVLLTLVTILANNYQVAGGYFALFYFAGIFSALVLSYLELFFAPTKNAFARHHDQVDESASRPLTGTTNPARSDDRQLVDDDATETTSLLRGDRRSFARYSDRRQGGVTTSRSQAPVSRRTRVERQITWLDLVSPAFAHGANRNHPCWADSSTCDVGALPDPSGW